MRLAHIKPGDKLAVRDYSRSGRFSPKVSHYILTVVRLTATQAIARYYENPIVEWRIRLSDGRVLGEIYTTAVQATPELLAQHAAEVDECQRWRKATESTQDLIGRPLHGLNLTTPQLERLAAAWVEVKAMEGGAA